MSEATLYGYWRSSATYRARIALNLKGVAYDTVAVHLLKDEQFSEEHRLRYPPSKVPVLAIDGTVIGQSIAMIEYLEETRPEPPLLPSDPKLRARVRDLVGQIASDIHPINNLSVLNQLRDQFGADEDAIGLWYRHWIALGFSALEQMLPGQGDFCVGGAVSLADVCLVPQVANARRYRMEVEAFPNVARIDARLRQIKAFRDAAPESQPEAKQT
jgi:maleylacetoacetate isomerase